MIGTSIRPAERKAPLHRIDRPSLEFGLYSLSDLVPSPETGQRTSSSRRIAETIEAAKLADQAGFDMFGVGEHHRLDFAVSSPAVVLAAIAAVTQRIRLTSAVTVLGAADPVRVFEDFATLDLVSAGRAEMIVGRGVFVEPFNLSGLDLADYDALFSERFDLLRAISEADRVTWQGWSRPPLVQAEIAPRPLQRRVPTWIAVGGSPASAERAGRLGAPMALAILGGPVERFASIVASYRQAVASVLEADSRVAICSHVHVGETSQSARDTFYPHHARYWADASPRGRGLPTMSRSDFEIASRRPSGLLVGSADEVAERMIAEHELLGHDRFLAQIDIGALPYPEVARVIDRLATRVVPQVRAAIARRSVPLSA